MRKQALILTVFIFQSCVPNQKPGSRDSDSQILKALPEKKNSVKIEQPKKKKLPDGFSTIGEEILIIVL